VLTDNGRDLGVAVIDLMHWATVTTRPRRSASRNDPCRVRCSGQGRDGVWPPSRRGASVLSTSAASKTASPLS